MKYLDSDQLNELMKEAWLLHTPEQGFNPIPLFLHILKGKLLQEYMVDLGTHQVWFAAIQNPENGLTGVELCVVMDQGSYHYISNGTITYEDDYNYAYITWSNLGHTYSKLVGAPLYCKGI